MRGIHCEDSGSDIVQWPRPQHLGTFKVAYYTGNWLVVTYVTLESTRLAQATLLRWLPNIASFLGRQAGNIVLALTHAASEPRT